MSTQALAPVLRHHEIISLAELINGCRRSAKVTWAVDGDVTRIMEGTLRHITNESGNAGFADPRGDIREQFVRITVATEHWLSVSEILALMAQDLFVIKGASK